MNIVCFLNFLTLSMHLVLVPVVPHGLILIMLLSLMRSTNDLDVAFKYLTSLFSYGQVRDEIQKEMLQLASK